MSDRELTLKLGTKTDGNIAEPLEKLSRASKEATEQEKRYQEILRGRSAAMGQLGRGAASLNTGGMAQGAMGMMAGAGPAAAVMAAFAAISAGAGKAADAMNVLNNGSMTLAQKQDALAKQFIPGAESFIKLRDAVTGVTESLRQLNLAHQGHMLVMNYQQDKEMRDTAARAEYGRAENRARAFGDARVPETLLGHDRSTYSGELGYQQAALRFPHQAAIERAAAERDAAKADYGDSSSRLARMESARGRLMNRMNQARLKEDQTVANGNVFDPWGASAGENRVARTQAGLEALRAEQDVLNNEAAIQAEINRRKELGVTLAQKESEIRKANNNLLKAELQILQQKEQRQSHAASSLGMMGPAQQMMAVQAARMMKQGMPVNLMPPQMRALVQQVNPGYVNKLAETQGAGSEAFKQLQEMGVVDKGTLAETRKEMAKVQTQVEVNVKLDEDALAKRIAEALKSSLGKLIDSLNAKFKAQGEQMRTGNQLRNAQQ